MPAELIVAMGKLLERAAAAQTAARYLGCGGADLSGVLPPIARRGPAT
jgi:hypothetical protein